MTSEDSWCGWSMYSSSHGSLICIWYQLAMVSSGLTSAIRNERYCLAVILFFLLWLVPVRVVRRRSPLQCGVFQGSGSIGCRTSDTQLYISSCGQAHCWPSVWKLWGSRWGRTSSDSTKTRWSGLGFLVLLVLMRYHLWLGSIPSDKTRVQFAASPGLLLLLKMLSLD